MTIKIDMLGFSITQDEGNPYWECSIELNNIADLIQFKPGDPFTLNMQGELYHFVVDKLAINKSGPSDYTASVGGVGTPALLSRKFDQPVTKTWAEDAYAHDIVQEILRDSVTSWEIPNWVIDANVFSVENMDRLEAAKQIIEAAGGVLESTPAGDLLVRPLWPTSPTKYTQPATVIDEEYQEVLEVFSVELQYENTLYKDWVRIRDTDQPNINDTVDVVWDDGTQLKGYLRVFPYPWRAVTVEHTGPSNVTLQPAGEDTVTTERALLEITEGTGTTTLPVESITAIEWHAVDLEDLTYEEYTKDVKSTSATEKYSLAYITYVTRFIKYRIESPVEQDVQFLVVDVEEE